LGIGRGWLVVWIARVLVGLVRFDPRPQVSLVGLLGRGSRKGAWSHWAVCLNGIVRSSGRGDE
jgi:hypothetical protein